MLRGIRITTVNTNVDLRYMHCLINWMYMTYMTRDLLKRISDKNWTRRQPALETLATDEDGRSIVQRDIGQEALAVLLYCYKAQPSFLTRVVKEGRLYFCNKTMSVSICKFQQYMQVSVSRAGAYASTARTRL